MYLAIDIGGTKTLVASFSSEGELLEQVKFPTPQDYRQFIDNLGNTVDKMSTNNLQAVGVAVPGLIDREKGVVYALGNLPWRDESIRDDISAVINNLPVIIENDARLAGLAEAVLLKAQYRNVLYLTVSTGIGCALLQDGHIVKELEDTEMGKMPLLHGDQIVHWEDFASGRAIVERYGKKASEIDDPEMWQAIGNDIGYGLGVICSVLQPQAIVFGGGAGKFAGKFKQTLTEYLEKELHPVVRRPKAILVAKYEDNGGIRGCYEILKQRYGEQS